MITLNPIQSLEEFQQLQAQAASDGGHIVGPASFIARRGEQIIGSFSVVPMVWVWADTRVAKAKDSVQGLQLIESHLRLQGNKVYGMPCRKTSPFFPVMEKLHFLECTEYQTFLKNL